MNNKPKKRPSEKLKKTKDFQQESTDKPLSTSDKASEADRYGGMNMENFKKNLGCG